LHIAKDRVGYTTLKAAVAGSVTPTPARSCRQGKTVFQVRDGDARGGDAVVSMTVYVLSSPRC
jgi:hypothetical protein